MPRIVPARLPAVLRMTTRTGEELEARVQRQPRWPRQTIGNGGSPGCSVPVSARCVPNEIDERQTFSQAGVCGRLASRRREPEPYVVLGRGRLKVLAQQ